MESRIKKMEKQVGPLLDSKFEDKLLASQLVSEIRKSPGHYSFTLTDTGVTEFARALQKAAFEEVSEKMAEERDNLFPNSDGSLIPKKQVMLGFDVSHATLWKWHKTGYLIPDKVGKRVYYRREDIKRLLKKS